MSAYVGRDVLVEFAIAPEDAVQSGLVWLSLGMMRGKELKATWDSVDTTGDKSPEATRTSLSTFKAVEFSGDGVSYDDAIHNQFLLEQHVILPGAVTSKHPKVWFRITYPNKMYVGPFLVTEFTNSTAYDNEATWKISAKSNGAVTPVAI